MSSEIVEEKFEVDDVTINYVKVGTGPQVLLLLPGTLGTWETDFGELLRTLDGTKYTMVCWDPPGYGKSRPFFREFTPSLYEEDARVAQKLMQHLKLDRYAALGWSEGGRAAYYLAAMYPDSVQKVVTWGTVMDVSEETMEAFSQTADFSIWPKSKVDSLTEIYGKRYFEELWLRYIDSGYELIGLDIGTRVWKKIKQPCLVMYGSHDRVNGEKSAYFKNIAENLLPNGRFLIREGANHEFHKQLRHKEWFKETVESFLAEP